MNRRRTRQPSYGIPSSAWTIRFGTRRGIQVLTPGGLERARSRRYWSPPTEEPGSSDLGAAKKGKRKAAAGKLKPGFYGEGGYIYLYRSPRIIYIVKTTGGFLKKKKRVENGSKAHKAILQVLVSGKATRISREWVKKHRARQEGEASPAPASTVMEQATATSVKPTVDESMSTAPASETIGDAVRLMPWIVGGLGIAVLLGAVVYRKRRDIRGYAGRAYAYGRRAYAAHAPRYATPMGG